MSEVQEQTQNVHKLAEALILARTALAGAEAAAKEYNAAVAAGAQQAELAAAAVHEANIATARAEAQAAEATLKAAVDGTAARREAERAAREAAQAVAAAAAEMARAEREAAEEARNTAAAMREQEKAASLVAGKLDKLKELTIGAVGGEETVEKYKKGTEALKLFSDKSMTAGQRAVAGGVAVKQFASAFAAAGGAALGAATTIVQLIADMHKAEAAAAQYDARLGAVSGSLAAMRAATAGAVDVQVAFNTSFALADRGIQANSENMALLARATREFARDRQMSQEQASAVVQRALDGDAQAATQLGLRLSDTTSTTQRHAAIMQQLGDRYRGVAAEQQTAAERAQVLERAQEQASNKLKSFLGYVGMGVPLGLAYSAVVNRIANQSANTDAATKAQTRHNAVLKQSADLARARLAAEDQRAASERRNATITLGALNEELQRRGESVEALGRVVTAEQAYGRARLDATTATQRADENETQFTQRKIELAQRLTDAVRRRNAEATRQDTIRNAQAEVGLLAQQIRAAGGVVDARIRSITPAQRLLQLQRELAEFAAREGDSVDETIARRTQLMQQVLAAQQAANQANNDAADAARAQRELNDLLNEAANLHVKLAVVETRAGEGRAERLGRQIQAQRELNDAMQQTYDAAQEAFERFREQTAERVREAEAEAQRADAKRTQLELETAELMRQNDLAKEEARREQNAHAAAMARADSFEQRMRDAYGLAEDQATTSTQAMVEATRAGTGSLRELAESSVSALIEASKNGKDAGAALAAAVDQWATTKAVQWGMQSAESFAGAGLAYFIRPDAVPGLLASGAAYAALALGAGVTAAAIPDAPSGGAAAGGRAGEVNSSVGMASARNENAAGMRDQPAVVVNISGVMANEQTQSVLLDAMHQLQDRGLTG